MDANSRRSWAPLETVELPDDPELQVYFPEEKVVSVDAFLDVLVMIRDSGKRRLVVQGITRETALLFLRVFRSAWRKDLFKRLENVLTLPVVSEALGPQEAKILRILNLTNGAEHAQTLRKALNKLNALAELSGEDLKEAEMLRAVIEDRLGNAELAELLPDHNLLREDTPARFEEALRKGEGEKLKTPFANLVRKVSERIQKGKMKSAPQAVLAIIRLALENGLPLSTRTRFRCALLEGRLLEAIEELFAIGDAAWIEPEPFEPMNPRYVVHHEDTVDSELHLLLFSILLDAVPPFGTAEAWAEVTAQAVRPDAPDSYAVRWLRLRSAIQQGNKEALLAWSEHGKGPMETVAKTLAGILELSAEDPADLDPKALIRREKKLDKLARARLVRASAAFPATAFEALWYAAIAMKEALERACLQLGLPEASRGVNHRLPSDNAHAFHQKAFSTVRRLTFPIKTIRALPEDATAADISPDWLHPELTDEELRRKIVRILARTPLETRTPEFWQTAAHAADAGFLGTADITSASSGCWRTSNLLTYTSVPEAEYWVPRFDRSKKLSDVALDAAAIPVQLAPEELTAPLGDWTFRGWYAVTDGCYVGTYAVPGRTDVELALSINTRAMIRRSLAQQNIIPNHYPDVALAALVRPNDVDAVGTFGKALACLIASPPDEDAWDADEPFDLLWRGSPKATKDTGFELFGFCGNRHESWVPRALQERGVRVVTLRTLRSEEATATTFFGLASLIDDDAAGRYATIWKDRPHLLRVEEGEAGEAAESSVALGEADPAELCLVDARVARGELPVGRILPVKPQGRPTALWFTVGNEPVGVPTPANTVLMRLRDAARFDPKAAPLLEAAHFHPFVRWRDGSYRLYEEPAA